MSYTMLQALGADLGWDQYKSIASAAATASPGSLLIVKVSRTGVPSVATFASKAAMNAAWDALYSRALPSNIGFAALFDKAETEFDASGMIEQKANPLIETMTTRKLDLVGLVPWAIGGALLVTAAVMLTRPAKGKPRKRARPTWRRRMVTVWR